MLSNSGRDPTQRGGCLALAMIEQFENHICKKRKRFKKHEILSKIKAFEIRGQHLKPRC